MMILLLQCILQQYKHPWAAWSSIALRSEKMRAHRIGGHRSRFVSITLAKRSVVRIAVAIGCYRTNPGTLLERSTVAAPRGLSRRHEREFRNLVHCILMQDALQ
jgi:hypothetical protein